MRAAKPVVVRLVRPLDRWAHADREWPSEPAVGDEGLLTNYGIDCCLVEFVDRNGKTTWSGWLPERYVLPMG